MIRELEVVAVRPPTQTVRQVELNSRPIIDIGGSITPLEEINADSDFIKSLGRMIEDCIC